MGGYYAEPQEDASSVKHHPRRHMMFGVNCFERKLVWQSDLDADCGGTITYLEPVEDDNEDYEENVHDSVSRSTQSSSFSPIAQKQQFLLAEQIVNGQFDLSNYRTVVELGASVVSLAAARIQRRSEPQQPVQTTTSVVAYDVDEIRLRILQYADRYLNPAANDAARPTVPIQTIHLEFPTLEPDHHDGDHVSPYELPDTADLVIVTTPMMHVFLDNSDNNFQATHDAAAGQHQQQAQLVQQLLHQATERSIPIVYTTPTIRSFP